MKNRTRIQRENENGICKINYQKKKKKERANTQNI